MMRARLARRDCDPEASRAPHDHTLNPEAGGADRDEGVGRRGRLHPSHDHKWRVAMAGYGDWESSEYQALMTRGRDAERTSVICWTASGLAAAILLSWGIEARSSSLMIPVIFAAAF